MATYITRTPSSTTDAQRKTWTASFWAKLANIGGSSQEMHFCYASGGGSSGYFRMDNDLKFRFREYTNGGSPDYLLITNRVFKDLSAWYHFVLRVDTTQGTAADRVRLYVNGTQESWSGSNYPAQDYVGFMNSTIEHRIGESSTSALRSFYLSQYIMAAGQSLAPTTFGSTNANGIWVPNTSPSVAYGNNGFKLDFTGSGSSADSSGFGADSSGNNNHFASTALGTNPNTKDGPANNFSVMNGVNIFPNSTPTTAKGNLETQSQSTSGAGLCSTIAVSAGKWYAEGKIGTGATLEVGAVDIGSNSFTERGTQDNSVGYDYGGNIRVNNSNAQTGISTFTGGDIVGIALNMDTATGTVTFYKNGSAVGSAQNFTTSKPNAAAFYMQSHTSSGNQSVEWNYGNPTFAIASSNADANGEGSFEYAPPTGYYALCTNNLALYGG